MSHPIAAPAQSVSNLHRKIGWCAILFGCLGAHKFLLGYNRAGFIMLAIGVLGWFPFAIPTLVIAVIGVIEGIIYLRKTDDEFEETYLRKKREWF